MIMNIYGMGFSGLIGSRLLELLYGKYSFINLSRKTGVDITLPDTLNVISTAKDKSVVLHLAAKTDVDGCEKDKALGVKGEAWIMNVIGVSNVIAACKKAKKKMIYIST